MHMEGLHKVKSVSCSVISDSVTPWTVACQALLSRMGGHSLYQLIFPTQGSNPGLLHCRLSHQGSPVNIRKDCIGYMQILCHFIQGI